jgi:FMN phosphatase YigB (HAD superfamily)
MVKAIVFDCFGVLATEAWLPFKAKYFADNRDLYEQASDIAKQANRGLISHQDFIAQAAELAGIGYDEASAYISRNVADEELFSYLRELKKKYKLGFLSNIAGNYLHMIFSDEQLALFDIVELSYKSGYIKPEAGAYENMAKRLDVAIGETVLVDDSQRNITGAEQAGMQAILYSDVEQLKLELRPLLKD